MRYSQLSPAMRAQVDAKLGKQTKARTTQNAATGAKNPGLPLSCTRCDFVALPATEGRLAKHQEATGHSRFHWQPVPDPSPPTA